MAQKRISDFFGGPKSKNSRCTSTSVDEEFGAVAILSSGTGDEGEEDATGVPPVEFPPRPRGDSDPDQPGLSGV